MSVDLCRSEIAQLWEELLQRRPMLVYATTWTALIVATVAAVSLAPEFAFLWSLSPSSPFARACGAFVAGAIRLPLDAPPSEVVCVPAELFGGTGFDLIVPPVFAAAVVAGAAFFVRAVGLWEADEDPT
ncbi:hypothetical protein AXF42_Ash019996 [Apostasia shenzhenica]|uniref:Uncharacterized protein n=1 Tax=Apostasia shenzhenica TaxID=1088818 RepID=A0A2H9ZSI0_9ASPA|nr:hypothetical protein AXF42_Ash019996 [Apostasia shenzhenica]